MKLVKGMGVGLLSALMATTALAEIKVGFIGSLSSDTGLSTLRGAEMAIEELNAQGGVMGEKITLVTADTGEDVTEGVNMNTSLRRKRWISLSLDQSMMCLWAGCHSAGVSDPNARYLDILYQIIDMVIEDPDTMAPYFMNIASDEALATLYINFGADVLKAKMGWDSVVVLAEYGLWWCNHWFVTDAPPQLRGSKSKMLSPMTLIP